MFNLTIDVGPKYSHISISKTIQGAFVSISSIEHANSFCAYIMDSQTYNDYRLLTYKRGW